MDFNPLDYAKYLNPVYDTKQIFGINDQHGSPGVGGPAQDPSRLQRQPNGTFLDPATGTSYSDQSGQMPIAAQNQAQQTVGATANQNQFLGRIGEQDLRSADAFGGQQKLAGDLQTVIRNPNAPSVAQQQLNQTIGNIDRQQLAGVASSGGPNAAAARSQALKTMAGLDLQAAGIGALARTNEVAHARDQLGTIYQNQAGNANTATGQNISAATQFGDQALTGAGAVQRVNSDAEKNNNALNAGLLGGAVGAGQKIAGAAPTG